MRIRTKTRANMRPYYTGLSPPDRALRKTLLKASILGKIIIMSYNKVILCNTAGHFYSSVFIFSHLKARGKKKLTRKNTQPYYTTNDFFLLNHGKKYIFRTGNIGRLEFAGLLTPAHTGSSEGESNNHLSEEFRNWHHKRYVCLLRLREQAREPVCYLISGPK